MNERSHPSSPTPAPRRTPRGLWAGVIAAGVLLAVLVATVVVTAPAAARGWFGHRQSAGHDVERVRERALFATSWALHSVDASDAQQAAVEVIVSDTVDELMNHGFDPQLRERLVAELTGPSIDREALETLRSEQVDQIEQISHTLIEALADIGEVLTAEQRQELAELASHRH